ncbi:unnamed protein product [Effrenium voratum]|nr:unnamed protein product [Effrenium voratum]
MSQGACTSTTALVAKEPGVRTLQTGGIDENGWYSKNGALVQRSQETPEHLPFGQVSATQQGFMDHVQAGRVDRVEDLLEFHRDKIEIDFQDALGQTPLMLATLAGSIDMVEILLEARADPHIRERTEMAYTPLEAAQVIMEDEDPDFEELVQLLSRASGHESLPSKRSDHGYEFRR